MTDEEKDSSYIGYGVACGLISGALFSVVFGMFISTPLIWAFGPGIGMMIGIVIGSIMDFKKQQQR